MNTCYNKDCENRINHSQITKNQEELKQKAIEAINQLLQIEKVAFIIYVDDKFDIEAQKEEFTGRVKHAKHAGIELSNPIFESLNLVGPDFLIDKFWDEFEDKKEILKAIFEVCIDPADTSNPANIIPALEVSEYFSTKIHSLTPDDWIDKHNELISGLKEDEQALCLFDFNFQKGNTKIQGKTGADLVSELMQKEELNTKIICGIFSSKFNESEEDLKRNEYADKYRIDKKRFYTISKYRYHEDPKIQGFAEGIKNLLLLPHIEKLKDESLKVLRNSNKNAAETIEDITPNTFNQIVQKSSLKEGIWEISTLFRLYGHISKTENYYAIKDSATRNHFNDSINKIRKIDLIDTGYISPEKNSQLNDLRENELYFYGDIINSLHLPISNGDIFKIDKKEYILLVQPCNLAIRASKTDLGKRSKNYNNAFLIPIKQCERNDIDHTRREILSTTNTDEHVLCAYFSEFKILSLDYLDLTVFNENGKSMINMNTTNLDNKVIHAPWLKRYELIHNKLLSHENGIKLFLNFKQPIENEILKHKEIVNELKSSYNTKTPDEIKNIRQKIKPINEEIERLRSEIDQISIKIHNIENFEYFKLNNVMNYDIESRIFTFKITRVRHYKPPYSDDLLQCFMQYLSRNAFDHDFTV